VPTFACVSEAAVKIRPAPEEEEAEKDKQEGSGPPGGRSSGLRFPREYEIHFLWGFRMGAQGA
jgi:hypothetical protein